MRIRVRRGGRSAVAWFLVAGAALGCSSGNPGGETGGNPGGEPGGNPGTTIAPPATPVSQCSVTSNTAISSDEASSPAVAYGGGHFAVVSSSGAHGGAVVLAIVDMDGRTLHQQTLSTGNGTSTAVAALPGGGYLVAWEERTGTGGTVLAVRVGADGIPAGNPITVATSASAEAHPDVAAGRGGALITWTEASGGYVAEVTHDAIANKTALPGAAQTAVVAGSKGAAVWSAGPQIGFRTIAMPGAAAAPPVMFRSAPGRANLPRAAAGPDGYGVVWEDTRGGSDNEAVYFARIGADGRTSPEVAISPGGGSADYPDVAFVGDRAAVTYYQFRDGPPAVYLRLVDENGARVGEELQVSGHGGARFPRIAWAGGGNLGIAYAQRGGPVRLAIVDCH
jgi:hypothetical protein